MGLIEKSSVEDWPVRNRGRYADVKVHRLWSPSPYRLKWECLMTLVN